MLNQLIRNQQGRLPNWLGIVIVLIILVTIALTIVWMNRQAKLPAADTGAVTPPAALQERHTVVGSIVVVTENQIQILVSADSSQFNTDKIYRVNYDSSTVITKRKLPESLEPGEQVIVNAEPGDVTELVTNIDVIVTADADISQVDEFFATSIELRN